MYLGLFEEKGRDRKLERICSILFPEATPCAGDTIEGEDERTEDLTTKVWVVCRRHWNFDGVPILIVRPRDGLVLA